MWGPSKPRLANARIKCDNLMGFGVDWLPIVRKGEQTKVEGERLKRIIFKQCVIDHPIVPWQNNTRWFLKWNSSFYSHKWKYKSKSIIIVTTTICGLWLEHICKQSTQL
jgi:hypothetical protein